MDTDEHLLRNESDNRFGYPFEDDYFSYFQKDHPNYAIGIIYSIFIAIAILTNVLGLAALVRIRAWLKHEGHLYLVAIFATNIAILIFDATSYCLSHWHFLYYPPNSSDFMCRVWHFFMNIFFATGWLSTALLFNVYLREHLVHRRRCGCPGFAAKYCTLFASKVIIGVIFGVVFIFALPHLGFYMEKSRSGHNECVVGLWYYNYFVTEFALMWGIPFLLFLPIVLILTLCVSRTGARFGFSQIQERSPVEEQFRVLAVTIICMTFFSEFTLIVYQSITSLAYSYYHVLSEVAYVVCLGLQPIFSIIILTKLRDDVLQLLRSIPFSRRFVRERPPTQTLLEEAQDELG